MEGVVTSSSNFWSKKRILFLGRTGFKRAWLGVWSRCMGTDVFGLGIKLIYRHARWERVQNTFVDVDDAELVMRPILGVR